VAHEARRRGRISAERKRFVTLERLGMFDGGMLE
jgi:hypothetical protein